MHVSLSHTGFGGARSAVLILQGAGTASSWSGTVGVFFSTFVAQPIGESSRQVTRGEDMLTSSEGTITWSFVARCVAAFPAVTCDGWWHVTEATGAYAGAHGAGTLHGELNLLGGVAGTGTDAFTGRIVQT